MINKKYIIVLVTFIVLISAFIIKYNYYFTPIYNHYFHKYNYQLPKDTENFIVAVEPAEYDTGIPKAFLNILKVAFPEYNIVISNKEKPHIIIKLFDNWENIQEINKTASWDAPYFTFSLERKQLSHGSYRRNGLPIVEFVSSEPTHEKQIYFPYVVWNTDDEYPHRKYYHNERKKFLAYISARCRPVRDNLFNKIKELKPSADALGKCPNGGEGVPGHWRDLHEVYKNYDFAFAMENHYGKGYITEKIFMAFKGGAIPIYWGDAKTLEEKLNFNPNAYINVNDFPNITEAAKYIVRLSETPEQIEKMRQEPIFKNNEVPDIFLINAGDLENPLIHEMAKKLRNNYLEEIRNNTID